MVGVNILALDLGTKTGWCVGTERVAFADTIELATSAELRQAKRKRLDRRLDIRIPRLYAFVSDKILTYNIDLVVFEDVLFVRSQLQAHLWSALRTTVWLAAHCTKTHIDCLNTTALKKFATGGGSAKKDRMLRHLKIEEPSFDFSKFDDNMVDAVWLYKWAAKSFRL